MDPSFSPGIDLFRTFATLATLAGAVDQPEDGCRCPVPGPEVFGPAPGPPSPEVAFCRAGSGPVLGLAFQPEILEVDQDQPGRAALRSAVAAALGRSASPGRALRALLLHLAAGPPGGEQGEVVRGDRRQ